MSMNAEVNEIDAEHVLLLVMENIIKYLDSKNLTNVANVCTSWRAEVLREKEKRFYIHQLLLPCEIGNLDEILDVNPSLSLCIYESTPALEQQPLHEKPLEDSIVKMPNKTIGVGMHRYLTTEDAKFQISKDSSDRGVLGLFLSNYLEKRARVQVVCLKPGYRGVDVENYAQIGDELIDRFGLNDREHPKSTLLVFTSWTTAKENGRIAARLCQRLQPDTTEMMLIGSSRIVAASFYNESPGDNVFGLVLLKFSGPNIESCTTHMNRNCSVDEIVSKLQEMKKRVRPRQYSIGLLYGYKCGDDQCSHVDHPVGDIEKIMQILKDIFPSVPFVGMFDKGSIATFWEDTHKKDYELPTYDIVTSLVKNVTHFNTCFTISLLPSENVSTYINTKPG